MVDSKIPVVVGEVEDELSDVELVTTGSLPVVEEEPVVAVDEEDVVVTCAVVPVVGATPFIS